MVILLITCFSLVALPMLADAKRMTSADELEIGVDMQAIVNMSHDLTVASPVPKFSFTIKKTLCANLDFGSMKGIVEKHPEAVKAMQAQGTVWAKEYNCRLCDIEGDDINIDKTVVKCNAYNGWTSDNLESACLAGNGKPGWRTGSNICAACPLECETCETPGYTDTSYWGWFKCIHPGEVAQTPVSKPWICEPVENRRKHRGQFQWCKYRSDLVETSTNGLDPEPSASWQLKLTGARCDKTVYEADKDISAIVKEITPKLNKYHSENCELCRVTVGGPLTPNTEMVFVLGDESTSKAWVDTTCAYDELGSAACRGDRGSTGWHNNGCSPCPLECDSCFDSSGYFGAKEFTCNLRHSEGVGNELAGVMLGSTGEDEGLPKVPEGFDCDKPKKRKCQTENGLCIGYETHCKYQIFS